MVAEVGGIRALPDQRFAELIPCVRMDMLAADKLEVASRGGLTMSKMSSAHEGLN